jgi:hypothetical protein
MKRLLIIITVILLIATPVLANSSSEYTVKHDLIVTLDGDYELKANIYTPAQGGMDLALDGIGKAYIESRLIIASVESVSSNWWDLF